MAKAETKSESKNGKKDFRDFVRMRAFLIRGYRDLLMHNPASMYFQSEEAGLKKATKIPTSEEEAAASRYVTDDGKYLWIPSEAFPRSWVTGSKGRRIGKMGASTILRAAVFPVEDQCIVLDADTLQPKDPKNYSVYRKRVQLPGQRGTRVSVLRSRARISNWACKLVVEIDELVQDAIVEEAGNIAGRIVGVCDYRPEKSGPFGRYSVELLGPA